jgi:hypothetical protein
MRDTAARSASKSSWISSRVLESMFEYYATPRTEIVALRPLKPKWRKWFPGAWRFRGLSAFAGANNRRFGIYRRAEKQ